MKKSILKFLFVVIALFANVTSAYAWPSDILNHLGLGVGVGTTGITIDAATPVTKFLQVRAGVDIMPGIKFHTTGDVEYSVNNVPAFSEMQLNGNLSRVQGHVIFNAYPIPGQSLFVAVGGYFGGNTLVKIDGHSDELAQYMQANNGSVLIGDYKVPVDKNGNVKGGLKVNGFRPYFGIGWGRSVPNKLLAFKVELGVQLHGTPQLYSDHGEIDKSLLEDDDTFQKIIDNVKVYPNLNFSINFRAF